MVSNLCLGTQRRSEHQLSPKNAGFTGGSPSLQFMKRKKVAEADSQPWATWPTLHFLQVTKSHEVKFFKLFTWVCYPTRPTTAVAPLFSRWQTNVKVGRWRVPGAQSHHWGGDHTAPVSLPNILAQAPQHARRTTKLSCRCANWGLHFQTHRKNHRTLSRHSKVYSSISPDLPWYNFWNHWSEWLPLMQADVSCLLSVSTYPWMICHFPPLRIQTMG